MKDYTNEFLRQNPTEPRNMIRSRFICSDGFSMSIQAGRQEHSDPKIDNNNYYFSVEVGFTSEFEESLVPYVDIPGKTFAFVPVDIVNQIIEKHGGPKKINRCSVCGKDPEFKLNLSIDYFVSGINKHLECSCGNRVKTPVVESMFDMIEEWNDENLFWKDPQKKDVILSIRPEYFRKIVMGEKTVEFRKSIWKKPVDRVLLNLCRSDSVGCVMGWFSIKEIISGEVQWLWKEVEARNMIPGISYEKYLEYYKGKNIAYAICIDRYFSEECFNITNVPQSWRYFDQYETIYEGGEVQ